MPRKVGLTYNLKRINTTKKGLPDDFFAEFDDKETINAISEALKRGGLEVIKIEANEEAYIKLKKLKPDIVFNIAEGIRGESRESQIPAILEMLGIPYTGSGPLTLAIALDKAITHQFLEYYGIPSPKFQVFDRLGEKLNEYLKFPLIVKPLFEGSSKGIRNNSLVKNNNDLNKQISWILSTYKQPAIVEEFLPGREFTIGLIGNVNLMVLPIIEILVNKLPLGANPIYSYEAKWIWDVPEKPLSISYCPKDLPKKLEEEMRNIAINVFNFLKCKDVCRIDIRLDKNNKPQVLEVNPLPGLIPNPDAHSCLPEAAIAAGYTYDQLICTIFWQALKRYDMQNILKDKSLVKLL